MSFLAMLAALLAVFQIPPGRETAKISAKEISNTLLKQSGCDKTELDPERFGGIEHLEYFDFTGDGKEEAIVVAATCWAGNSGPDVHAVFTRDAAGSLVELPFRREEGAGKTFSFDPTRRFPILGQSNYDLTVENGLLVARWVDASDRKNPLIIRYKWDGSAFVVESVKQSGPFKTSYDCSKATKEIEQAICYSESVSALDVELGNVYRERLRNETVDEKATLQENQRKWLAERESACVIYKGWVDCLAGLYRARIAELQRGTASGSQQISPDDVTDMLARQYDCERHQVHADHFEYYDFTGDGKDDLILVASTCMTGTAGPDVHAVYTRGENGQIRELPFAKWKGTDAEHKAIYGMLFPNANYKLSVQDGLLVETYSDSSDREHPLIVRYKWNGDEFVVHSVEKAGPFDTSFDCSKAGKEVEHAICYSKTVAALDVQLSNLYRQRLKELAPGARTALQEDQRKWLAERDSKCVIYKWWVDCLTKLYTRRIAELQPGKAN